jgi:O-acetylhomoserine (thiol)-lyase
MQALPTKPSVAPSLNIDAAKVLSPRRKSTEETTVVALAEEQLQHFGIDSESEYGQAMQAAVQKLYGAQSDITRLWEITSETIDGLDKNDRIAYFNAKKFLSFQVAKILDTIQNPFRKSYQSLNLADDSQQAKGPYPIFDIVTALFSANPVIVRTATYIYACTEWVDDAFHGKEALHEIYSRLLNPTSISLANYIVDLEAGPYADEYLAWNFNSGMAAIDTLLSHLIRHKDIVIVSRNVYGGTYQLLHDFYGDPARMAANLEWFDGYEVDEFDRLATEVSAKYKEQIESGSRVWVFIESPCNPHGYVLDVAGISKSAHEQGWKVLHDSTIATPFLNKPLQQDNELCRPDYLIHSYTKDLAGSGNATAGVVIAKNEHMFIPKGEEFKGVKWNETLFWDAYYIKGAFLDSDKAFEVISGIKTLEMRMMKKCINTLVLARFLDSNPKINVNCNALEGHWNYGVRKKSLRYELAAPLFTIDFEDAGISRETFVSLFDSLAPVFNHQVSLGQCNTTVLCPAFTSHSELDREALLSAGISQTTIRMAIGDENPKELMAHFQQACKLIVDREVPGFSEQFLSVQEVDQLVATTYLDVHKRYISEAKGMEHFLV